MKKFIFLFILAFALQLGLWAQGDPGKKKINLVNPVDIPELVEASQKIYPNRAIEFVASKAIPEPEILKLLNVSTDATFELSRTNQSR